jgi:hypothetical protein
LWWFHGENDLSADELNRRLIERDLVDPLGGFVATWLDGVTTIPDQTNTLSVTDIRDPVEVDTNLAVVEVTYQSTAIDPDHPVELQLFVELTRDIDGWNVVAIQ